MAFRLPRFNLGAGIWRYNTLLTFPADVLTQCNHALGRRSYPSLVLVGSSLTYLSSRLMGQPVEILLPPLTDVRYFGNSAPGSDVVEVPSGSGRFYVVAGVEDVGKGFPNEYRLAIGLPPTTSNVALFNVLNGVGQWPLPYP